MNPITITAQEFRKAADLQEKIQRLQKELEQILGAPATTAAPQKRKMSAAGRARIAAAARARWAKIKGAKVSPKRAQKPKRKMSVAAKARLAALARARWKQAKAQGKTRL